MYGNEFRPMKRAHSPDSEGNFRGQFRGPPGHPFHKRHRGDGFNQPQTIDDKIARLGDTGSRNVDIGALAKEIDADLLNKADEDEKIKNLTMKITKCIVAFPTRVATYSTLVGLISVKHYNVSCQIINSLHASYPVYLEAQKWQEALTIIHVLSSLVNCKVITPSAILAQFNHMLESIHEENIPQARSDYFVYSVLSSLPFVALELSADPEHLELFDKILSTIEDYLNKRSKSHLNVTRVWLSSDSTIQMDYLDSLWVQMKNFKANGWTETFLHRPYNDKEYKDIMASSLIPQNCPVAQIPPYSKSHLYPVPKIVFRIYEDDVTDGRRSIPGSDKIERFCIENHIRNIIDEIPSESRDCARHLSHMYRSDQLPMKHILIETLLGELFTLPQPRHREILYHSLLFELSKLFYPSRNPEELKSNFDVILNEAIKVLYENLDTMNVTCIQRFINWFSFHLNNTEYIYPWQSWNDSVSKDRTSPKAVFVYEILDKCIRLSFHKKISTLVSGNLDVLVPAEINIKYQPVNSGDPKAEELAATIKKLIVEKADGKTICETLNIIIDGVELPDDFELKEEKHSVKMLKIDIFTAVILSIASKSLTHLSSAIGKFRNVFRALTKVEQGQSQLLQTMHSCLEAHSQLQVILVDKLLKADLIDAREVCRWIFSEPMRAHLIRSYPWELLSNTMSRVLSQLMKLNKERGQRQVEEVKNGDPTTIEGENTDVEMKPEDNSQELLDEKIARAKIEYDEMVLEVFKMFFKTLQEHVSKCEISNKMHMDDWFKLVSGRMQQFYYENYFSLVEKYDEIKAVVDSTPSIGAMIVNLNQ